MAFLAHKQIMAPLRSGLDCPSLPLCHTLELVAVFQGSCKLRHLIAAFRKSFAVAPTRTGCSEACVLSISGALVFVDDL